MGLAWRLWIPAALVAVAGVPAHATEVLLLRSGEGPQYEEAVAAFLGELGAPASQMTVDEGTTLSAVSARAASERARVVAAMGARAAALSLGAKLPVVAFMVLQGSAVPHAPGVVGVTLAPGPTALVETALRVAPRSKKLGLLYDGKHNDDEARALEAAARERGLSLVATPVGDSKSAVTALESLAVDALLLIPDATVVSKAFLQALVARSFERQLPVVCYSESFVKLGLLAALAPSYSGNGRAAAAAVKVALAGGPRGASVAGPTVLVVNAGTARRLGLSLAPALLRPPTVVVGGP